MSDTNGPAVSDKQSKKSNMARGGSRPGAGRKPGMVTKAKRELAEMAQEHADTALTTLVTIAQNDEAPPAARVTASVAILDRAYGKPPQGLEIGGKDGGPLVVEIIKFGDTDAGRT